MQSWILNHMTWQWIHFAHVRNWLLTKKRMAHWIESWNWIKHWRIIYENDIKRKIQLCVKIKKSPRVNIEFFTGRKKIKQRRIPFVLGYLCMILWNISTAISIKHRIVATFNENKSIMTAYMPLINTCTRIEFLKIK
jgi:hypothetical protein